MPLFISVFDMFLCIARNSVSGSFSKGRWEAFQNFGRIYTPEKCLTLYLRHGTPSAMLEFRYIRHATLSAILNLLFLALNIYHSEFPGKLLFCNES